MSAAERHITEAGVYGDLPHADYLTDPVPWGSLSASGARRLLPPSCPALFRYWADHPEPPKDWADIGNAAHRLVLGVGPDITSVPFDSWRTNAARDAREKAYADGRIPLLAEEYMRVTAMADALREHPIAAALFDPERGKPEQSLFWPDAEADVWRRARLDWLPDPGPSRLIIADYKTTRSAEPEALAKSMHAYGYDVQAAWYIDAAVALDLGGEDTAFLLVAQETAPPYLVTIAEPDAFALKAARVRIRQALEVYAECTATGQWPGYTSEVISLSLPYWVERRYEQEWA